MVLSLKAYLAIAAAVIILGTLGYITYLNRDAIRAHASAWLAKGQATVAEGQTAAGQDAATITDKGATRDRNTANTRDQNHDAILAAPGGEAPSAPAAVDATRRSLCRYAAYSSDPACNQVRAPGSGNLSPAN